jgi:ketose-bisphosphate aldolase
MKAVAEIVRNAWRAGLAVPAFNVPYLPMIEPVVQAAVDCDCFSLVATARLCWLKFGARSAAAVAEEYARWARPDCVRLHLDHVPVIDEDNLRVDYLPIFREALALGYESVMIDGSRLDLEGNIAATCRVVDMASAAGVPCEAELGAVMGHEEGPLPPYEELYASGKGFTSSQEARRFVRESGCQWLSVAIGNVHGAVGRAARDQKKVEARLNIEHLRKLQTAAGVPLVLHGGSGVRRQDVLTAIRNGIAKVNIGTEVRQAYEAGLRRSGSVKQAQEAAYERTRWVICDYFGQAGTRRVVLGEA